jgi:hypothetical protein
MRSVNRDSTQENDRHSQPDQEGRDAETPIFEFSYEGLEEEIEKQRHRTEADELVDTAHTDGSTDNPALAQEQGLVYLPPSDPPVLPSDDPQGAEIAAGFASSMEETEPGAVDLPDRISGNDLDLEQKIRTVLHDNSETANMAGLQLAVRNGVVFLAGRVESRSDIAIVDEMLRDMQDIVDVRNHLEVISNR